MLLNIVYLFLAVPFAFGFDYSDNVYNTLFKLTYYPKIAYCSFEPTFKPGPLEDACPKIEFCEKSENTEIADIVRPDAFEKEISGTSYIAVDDKKKKIFVTFRGTLSPGDALTDITFLQCPYAPVLSNGIKYEMFSNISDPEMIAQTIKTQSKGNTICEDCLVHCGVYVEFTKFIGEVMESAKPY